MDRLEIHLIVSRRQVRGVVVLGVLFGLAYTLHSATVKFSTTYPSPSGVYRKLIVISSALLARDEGSVGVGTSNPQAKLDVNGKMNVSGTFTMGVMATDPAGSPGAVYYNSSSNEYRGYTNAGWRPLGGAVPPGAVSFFNLGQCPPGWSELPAAQGRYLVGRPPQGEVGATVGLPLADREDRPTGPHLHALNIDGTYCEPGNTCSLTSAPLLRTRLATSAQVTNQRLAQWGMGSNIGLQLRVEPRSNFVMTADAAVQTGGGQSQGQGSAQGATNAPYVQFLACVKN